MNSSTCLGHFPRLRLASPSWRATSTAPCRSACQLIIPFPLTIRPGKPWKWYVEWEGNHPLLWPNYSDEWLLIYYLPRSGHMIGTGTYRPLTYRYEHDWWLWAILWIWLLVGGDWNMSVLFQYLRAAAPAADPGKNVSIEWKQIYINYS